ncbi:MAG: hypothetical protein OES32_07185 [Acidobacteriota bacterium]|nr:hypothetical protein [Acidobacteriota bacterium]
MPRRPLLATLCLSAMTAAFLWLASPPGESSLTPGPSTAWSASRVRPVASRFADLREAPSRPAREGERDSRIDSSFSEAELLAFQAAALRLPPDPRIQTPAGSRGVELSLGTNFDSIDITECCDQGTLNPPDPELAVGPSHVIAVVNASLEIYDKSGTSLAGPLPFETFYSHLPGPCTVFPFDPNVLYDEAADRFIVGADGDGVSYCVGVTQTGDPLGAYFFYEFPTNVGGDFFDYPHAGVGADAIYVGANMFGGAGVGRVFAFEKAAMYAGLPAAAATRDLGSSGTPQPMNVHPPFPAGGPHYVLTSRGGTSNPSLFGLFSWDDPFGADVLTDLTTIDTTTVHGITVGFPISNPQQGGSNITAFNPRPLDFEARDGFGWFANGVSCNPGAGTRNCIQWARVDLAAAAAVDAGVFADEVSWRYMPDLAVNACGDLAIGYTTSDSSTFAGIRVAGRKADDPPGTLQGELVVKAGETTFGGPDRWGDYTGMTSDPDGATFWYLGEYAKDIPDPRNWGTYIGAVAFPDCGPGIFADGFESGDTSAWSTTVP